MHSWVQTTMNLDRGHSFTMGLYFQSYSWGKQVRYTVVQRYRNTCRIRARANVAWSCSLLLHTVVLGAESKWLGWMGLTGKTLKPGLGTRYIGTCRQNAGWIAVDQKVLLASNHLRKKAQIVRLEFSYSIQFIPIFGSCAVIGTGNWLHPMSHHFVSGFFPKLLFSHCEPAPVAMPL